MGADPKDSSLWGLFYVWSTILENVIQEPPMPITLNVPETSEVCQTSEV